MKATRPLLAATTLLLTASLAWAQGEDYPNKPITLVIPFSAGGPTDVVARALGVAMTKTLGKAVVVENKTGAGGTLAAAYVAKTAPDGYTLLLHFRAALKDPEFQAHMKELGAQIVAEDKQTPEGLRSWLKAEADRYAPVIKAAGVYAD